MAQSSKALSQFWQCGHSRVRIPLRHFSTSDGPRGITLPDNILPGGGGGGVRVAGLGRVISYTSQKLSISGTYFSQCKTWRIRVRWISR